MGVQETGSKCIVTPGSEGWMSKIRGWHKRGPKSPKEHAVQRADASYFTQCNHFAALVSEVGEDDEELTTA